MSLEVFNNFLLGLQKFDTKSGSGCHDSENYPSEVTFLIFALVAILEWLF